MKISNQQNLTYCLNVHPGETWQDTLDSIKEYALSVRDQVAPNKAFGLGLRLGYESAKILSSGTLVEELKQFLSENNLYVFTVNGFPYGTFHDERVKEDVYKPDWRTVERRDYTNLLADIMSQLIPDGVNGSISTVPGSYKSFIISEDDKILMINNLMDSVLHLAEISEETGKRIHIGLEPEPDCFIETTQETIDFFKNGLLAVGAKYIAGKRGCSEEDARNLILKHLGVCFDTCHLALQYEGLEKSLKALIDADILISKIQISSAIKIDARPDIVQNLDAFNDVVYLHQVKARKADGSIKSYADLPDALSDDSDHAGEEWRVHCHVPLYFEEHEDVMSTSSALTDKFFGIVKENAIEHLEIETYTFNVLPEALQERGVVNSIVDEYNWVLEKL